MDDWQVQQGLPPALLEALQTMSDGGMLFSVALAVPSSTFQEFVPCFVVRSPATKAHLAGAHIELTTRFVNYETEGPLTVFHAKIYDRPAKHQVVVVHGRVVGMQIQPTPPFEVECFANPTTEEDRLLLQALETSTQWFMEFYTTDAAMTYQATKRYPLPVEQQRMARQILEKTQRMHSSSERFLSAQERFQRENPLFG